MKIKKLFVMALASVLAFSLAACGGTPQNSSQSLPDNISTTAENTTLTDADRNEAEKIVNALAGSLAIAHSWDKITGDEYKYDLSLTTFYCILNPDYPSEIPAATYESFIHKYINTSDIDLREMDEYNKESETYAVSEDVSVDRVNQDTEEYFNIDSMEYIDGQIKVSYHTIWGNMAPSEGLEDSVVFAGYVLLDKEDGYRILKVELTEDNSNLSSLENANEPQDDAEIIAMADKLMQEGQTVF